MDAKVKSVLEELGFNPEDYIDCPDFDILHDLLLNINKENILSPEEVETLEYIRVSGITEESVAKILREQGIDEDVLEIDDSAVEYLEKKLRVLNLGKWRNLNDSLRQEKTVLMKVEKELKEKFDIINSNSCVNECEEKLKQISSELKKLFEDLKELKSMHISNDSANEFKEFSTSFEKELNALRESIITYLEETWNGVLMRPGERMQENAENTTIGANYSREKTDETEITKLEQRLTCLCYNKFFPGCKEDKTMTEQNLNIFKDIAPVSSMGNSLAFYTDVNNCETASLVLQLSNIRAQLQIHEEVILRNLECIKMQRESYLEAAKNLFQILQKQEVLLDLFLISRFLWSQESHCIQEVVNSCQKHFQEESVNTNARIACLEESKTKFESYLKDRMHKESVHLQMLEKVSGLNNVIGSELHGLTDMITSTKNKLEVAIEEQKTSLINSKSELKQIEENITGIQEQVNTNFEKLSHIALGFNTASEILERRKEEKSLMQTSIAESPVKTKKRLLWVHFLTDMKKLKDQLLQRTPEKKMDSLQVLSFADKTQFLTSTPKGDE